MNASTLMDKQIMELSRSKSDLSMNNSNKDFMDLMNPQSEQDISTTTTIDDSKQDEILPNYDFLPIQRPSSDHLASSASVHSNSLHTTIPIIPNSSSTASYGSLDRFQHDKIMLEKAQNVNDSDILSEIDRTMKRHTDGLMHAIDSVSLRLSQMESRTRHLEHSLDELKVSVGNNHGSADGKLRHLENILLEVQSGVLNLKDKQELMEGHMQLAKFQISKEQSSKLSNAIHQEQVHQAAAASAPPQQPGLQQFTHAVSQPAISMPPPNVLPPSQQNIHPPLPMTSLLPPATNPPDPQRDAYIPPPSLNHETPSQQYQTFPPGQYQQPLPVPQTPPQQYQPAPTPPYSQPSQLPKQQYPSNVAANTFPFQPLGHRSDVSPHVPSQTYPPNLHQPTSQPTSVPPQTQSYHGGPSSFYEAPPAARSTSGFASAYVPPPGPNEQYMYGGPSPYVGSGSSIKPQQHSPRASGSNYPQLPTARILPQAIPTASGLSGGPSTGGSANKVPIDDVVDKVTSMGFSREQVRETVRKLTENGQSVDLNVVLDKLMNDADVVPPRGWFGR